MELHERLAGGTAELVVVASLLLTAGCLPSSCQRMESTRLLPSDSLSRELATAAAVDTLRLEWSASGTDPHRLEFPRTVRFGRSDTIYVADVERTSLFIVSGGRVVSEVELPGLEAPYLAGVDGDTTSIFSPATLAFYRLRDGRIIDSTVVNDAGRERTSLVYGAAGDRLYYKRVDPEGGAFVAEVAPDGFATDTTRLRGPHWRYAGLLKTWGDTLISLSGFRPVIDFVVPTPERRRKAGAERRPAAGAERRPAAASDTLALVGFDSPMLARSRSFMRGDVHEAPLLSSSAAAAGDRLFVLNLRPGWLQVDVFGRDGVLQHRLVGAEAGTAYQGAFFPQDIDVRRSDRSFEIAVVYSEPDPILKLYRWTPAMPSPSADRGAAGTP